MKKLIIQRLTKSDKLPTYGVLIRGSDGVPFALTLERPWLNNERRVSCIPAGTYRCIRHTAPKFGNTYWIQDVPGRSEILFHKGAIAAHSAGCVLVGEQFNPVLGEDGITASAEGFSQFMSTLDGDAEFELVIRDPVAE
jgi:hypothetical protein